MSSEPAIDEHGEIIPEPTEDEAPQEEHSELLGLLSEFSDTWHEVIGDLPADIRIHIENALTRCLEDSAGWVYTSRRGEDKARKTAAIVVSSIRTQVLAAITVLVVSGVDSAESWALEQLKTKVLPWLQSRLIEVLIGIFRGGGRR